jgi:hypothetical protein
MERVELSGDDRDDRSEPLGCAGRERDRPGRESERRGVVRHDQEFRLQIGLQPSQERDETSLGCAGPGDREDRDAGLDQGQRPMLEVGR